MIYLCLFLIAALAILNFYLERNILYPPALFASIWAGALFGLVVSGDRFYPLTSQSLLIFFGGVAAISLGGILSRSFRLKSSSAIAIDRVSPSRHRYVRRILDWALLICVVGLPFYWQKAVNAAEVSGRPGFFAGIRQEVVNAEETVTPISLVDNLAVLAIIVAPIFYLESDDSSKRQFRNGIAIVVALIYSALTASKGAMLHVILVPLIVYWLKKGRPSFFSLLIITVTCVALFAGGVVLVNLIDVNVYDPFDLTLSALEIVPNYMLGSLVAFDRIVTGANVIDNPQGVLRGFRGIARKLGAQIQLPSIHAQYTMISNYENSNTYTMYFSYVSDLGIAGTVAWLIVLGMVTTLLYRAAMTRDPIAIIFYALIVDALVFSVHAEHILLGVNQLAKTLVLLYFMYRLPQFKLR